MLELFSRLSGMLAASAALAQAAAFVWGVLSVMLSPCHLAGIPLIIGHVMRKSADPRTAGLLSLLFAWGSLLTLLGRFGAGGHRRRIPDKNALFG